MSKPPEVEKEGGSIVQLPELPPVSITVHDAYPTGKWVTFKVCGFPTEDFANIAGRKFGDTLLVCGALDGLGVDIGYSRSTLQFSQVIHEKIRQSSGEELRSETHGLMVFPENRVMIMGLQGNLSVSIGKENFVEAMSKRSSVVPLITERIRNCALLLNDSFFVSNIESSFILRVSSVESLCDQRIVGRDYQNMIFILEQYSTTLEMGENVRDSIQSLLKNGKNQSIRQSYKEKFENLNMRDLIPKFDELYSKRSRFVHDGQGRGDLGASSESALQIATALLEAELRHTAKT